MENTISHREVRLFLVCRDFYRNVFVWQCFSTIASRLINWKLMFLHNLLDGFVEASIGVWCTANNVAMATAVSARTTQLLHRVNLEQPESSQSVLPEIPL
ncbi:hypothetical protein X777_09401 [Ooceraea biroi]|uniref:Uncharacterized protein n=1 Tax=Ooceraea biroi TaxID=2015173 RepID=A0A026X0F5_OOCBI|nr:hypothetical protein X777_09401 [Ooceraea biroi]